MYVEDRVMKYAVMVCFDGKDDWVYVTEQSLDNIMPIVYDTSELAEEAAEIWRLPGKACNVKVVTYDDQV